MSQLTSSRAWTITFAGAGINLALGVLYSWSVFGAALIDQYGWTKTESSIPYTLACVIFAICMVPAGRWLDKSGPRVVATVAAFLCGAGMLVAGMAQSVSLVAVGFGLLVGAAMGFGYAAPTPAAVKWFQPHKKGQIAGLVVAGFGLASVYIAPMTNYFLATFGVSKTFFIEAAIFFTVIVILAQFLAFPPAQNFVPFGGPPPASTAKASAGYTKKNYTPGEMVKTSQFYQLWLMFCFAASAGLLIIGHLAKISQIQGGINWGFALVAVLAIANAGGRILAGFISDRLGRTNTMLLVFSIQAINMFAFSYYSSAQLLLLGSVLTGLAYGSLLTLFPSATYDFFGMKNAGINYGLVFTAWGAAALVGPIIAGQVADATGGYGTSYIISGVLLLIAALVTFFTKAPQPVVHQKALET
ncbi:L-lactate MFS transporter [Desulfoscipio sp. XC116]|uniref:L-lactate MFS transporter n=1 Tax=Desulfoscipio sp. XC116 TaxID=3144975 RepID=UPI00325B1D57